MISQSRREMILCGFTDVHEEDGSLVVGMKPSFAAGARSSLLKRRIKKADQGSFLSFFFLFFVSFLAHAEFDFIFLVEIRIVRR